MGFHGACVSLMSFPVRNACDAIIEPFTHGHMVLRSWWATCRYQSLVLPVRRRFAEDFSCDRVVKSRLQEQQRLHKLLECLERGEVGAGRLVSCTLVPSMEAAGRRECGGAEDEDLQGGRRGPKDAEEI